jgi:hypothetical protein
MSTSSLASFFKEFELSDETLVEVRITGWYKFHPGRYSGPPENCFPDDEEWEVSDCDIITVNLTEEQRKEASEKIDDYCQSDECYEKIKKGDD